MAGNVARAAATVLAGGAAAATAAYTLVTDVRFQAASATGPLLRLFDAETAHRLGILAGSLGLLPADRRPDDARLAMHLWGRTFSNPLGIAAGFDKDGEAIEGVLDLGVAFMEVGSVTPQPQPGNPQPRCFRLPEERAIINRYGFNSAGSDAVGARLASYRARRAAGTATAGKVLAVNLGKNKESEDAGADYAAGVAKLAAHADVLVINVSSPNTPGLRGLQERGELRRLITCVQAELRVADIPAGAPRPPLLVKIAPDLSPPQRAAVAAVALETRIDGLVISNSTVFRPPAVAEHPHGSEAGGLSGAPLFEPSTEVLHDMYRRTRGAIPLIGCGGVSSGREAYAKLRAGASLVELYTGLVYEGPALIPRMKAELLRCLEADGLNSVEEAVGLDHRAPR